MEVGKKKEAEVIFTKVLLLVPRTSPPAPLRKRRGELQPLPGEETGIRLREAGIEKSQKYFEDNLIT